MIVKSVAKPQILSDGINIKYAVSSPPVFSVRCRVRYAGGPGLLDMALGAFWPCWVVVHGVERSVEREYVMHLLSEPILTVLFQLPKCTLGKGFGTAF